MFLLLSKSKYAISVTLDTRPVSSERAVSEMVNELSLLKPVCKFIPDNEGMVINDKLPVTDDNLVKSMLNTEVNLAMFNWPSTSSKPPNEIRVTEVELVRSKLPFNTCTCDKSTAPPRPSPSTVMSPERVGQAFNAATPAASVTVVRNRHLADDRAATAPDTAVATTTALLNDTIAVTKQKSPPQARPAFNITTKNLPIDAPKG